MVCLTVRPGAVWALSAAGGHHAGWSDDCRWGAAAAGRGPGVSVVEGPAGSRSRPANAFPQLWVWERVCVCVNLCMYVYFAVWGWAYSKVCLHVDFVLCLSAADWVSGYQNSAHPLFLFLNEYAFYFILAFIQIFYSLFKILSKMSFLFSYPHFPECYIQADKVWFNGFSFLAWRQ